MISFERTTDWETIKAIVTHPRIYPHVSDDGSPLAEQWEPIRDEVVWYVLVKDDAVLHPSKPKPDSLGTPELLGLWVLVPDNSVCWKIHTCLLPVAYGDRARIAAIAMVPWIWHNTGCLRVITDVPAYNRLALRFARAAGMKEYGVNPRSYMKNKKLYDQILLGISKPEALCQ